MEKTSRTLATNLRKLADWLDSRPEFPVPNTEARVFCHHYYSTDDFKAAVRALGPGKKGTGVLDQYLRYTVTALPADCEYEIEISREGLCRLVTPAQPAVYDCEPLLSQEEEAAL